MSTKKRTQGKGSFAGLIAVAAIIRAAANWEAVFLSNLAALIHARPTRDVFAVRLALEAAALVPFALRALGRRQNDSMSLRVALRFRAFRIGAMQAIESAEVLGSAAFLAFFRRSSSQPGWLYQEIRGWIAFHVFTEKS